MGDASGVVMVSRFRCVFGWSQLQPAHGTQFVCAAKSPHAAHSFLSRIGARITRLVAPFDGPSWVTSTVFSIPVCEPAHAASAGKCEFSVFPNTRLQGSSGKSTR